MAELDYDYLSSLVKRIQDGDTDAFAELYTATYQKQYWFACRFVKDQYLAQDILQELYILVLKHIKLLKNPELFTSWLNQINFRLCFDMNEKNSRNRNELCLDEASQALSGSSAESESPLDTYSQNLELFEQIKALPKRESQAILMKYYHSMSLDEIAFAMDCSKSSVKRYLTKGYEKLRRFLGDFEEGGVHQ